MLLIDDRIGSKDLLKPLQNFGVPAELIRLEYGDFAFIGRGLNGIPVHIGVELKETSDLIKSLQTKRIAGHQLRGLIDTYDRAWLLTEGIWRASDEGVLEVMRGGWRPASVGTKRIMVRDLDSQILTLCIRGGISHHHCSTRSDTIRWLSVLYHWWSDKDMDQHKSHLAFHQPDLDRALLEIPTLVRRIAKELPNVGWERSQAVDQRFKSVIELANASEDEWREIPGIGKLSARKIVLALSGESATDAYKHVEAERIAANRELLRGLKSEPCVDCGHTYPYYVMEFDHARGEKKHVVSHMTARSMTAILEEVEKCDVVCANCHNVRTHNRRLVCK